MFGVFSKQGEQQEVVLKEARENFKILEEGLKGKKFFGGETIGSVDIVAGWLPYWVRIQEEVISLTMEDEKTMPLLCAWFKDFLDLDIVKELLPPRDKVLDHNREIRQECLPAMFGVFSKQGEQQEVVLKEAHENFNILEEGLKGKLFFGGETIGFVNIVAGWLPYWVRIQEEVIGLTMVDEKTMPLLCAWFKDFLDLDIVKELLPPRDKVLDLNREFCKRLLTSST